MDEDDGSLLHLGDAADSSGCLPASAGVGDDALRHASEGVHAFLLVVAEGEGFGIDLRAVVPGSESAVVSNDFCEDAKLTERAADFADGAAGEHHVAVGPLSHQRDVLLGEGVFDPSHQLRSVFRVDVLKFVAEGVSFGRPEVCDLDDP